MADTTTTATDQQGGKAVEQSTGQPADQAGAAASGVEGQGTAGDSTEIEETDEEPTEEESIELLGKDDYDKVKGDPEALRTALNKAATQKFQQLSKERRELAPYRDFIRALDRDPAKAIVAVAKQFGLEVKDGRTEAETREKVVNLADQVTATLKSKLGTDYEDLAPVLGPAILAAMEVAIPALTKDSKEALDKVITDSAQREANQDIEAFAKRYPDWQKYEEQMVALSERMQPGEGMNGVEYLENLYILVTRDRKTGDGVKKVITKMAESAKRSSGEGSTVADKNVSRSPNKPPTFAEAAAAAMRGERFE